MNYEESRAYIRAAELKKGIVLGLENMRELMRRLGDPQDELKYVHVAGTNINHAPGTSHWRVL